MKSENDLRFAVLIDAENIPSGKVKEMLEEISKYGTPTYKRIYGNWTSTQLAGWKNSLLEHAITPIQQYSYTSGKNATDSAMIIDAMDILYSGKVEGFCIVSSDSDFTRLATRLRESGMQVIGIGERKTPKAFIVACNKFIYLEILTAPVAKPVPEATAPVKTRSKAAVKKPEAVKTNTPPPLVPRIDPATIDLIVTCATTEADETGWASLASVGNLIGKQRPDFDSRNFGYLKLSQLIKNLGIFDIDEREGKGGMKSLVIRQKKRGS
jgi:uncharacterized LabA/DUF88 family protein